MRRSNAYYYRKARQYALDVVTGKILACKWIILAAQRYLDDRTSSKSPSYPYVLDAAAAGKACRFIERMPLTKGEGAAKKKKLILEPWQCFVIVNIFGWLHRDSGYRRFSEAYVKIPRKNGKALALDTPIPTPTGWTTMGDLALGDRVLDENGRECTVLKVSDVMKGRECFRLRFSDGTSVIADADHQWFAKPAWGKPRVVTTKQMARRVHVDKGYYWCLSVSRGFDGGHTNLPFDPWMLGLWLGDGSARDARLTVGKQDADHIASELCIRRLYMKPVPSSPCSYWLHNGSRVRSRNSLNARMRRFGLFNGKRIPHSYLRASRPQRLALLRGLIDSDGHVTKRGQVEITTVLPLLSRDILELARSLGYKTSLSEGRAKLNGVDYGPRFRITFTAFADEPVATLPRKVRRHKPAPAKPTRARRISVTAVDPVESVPVRCVEVDSRSRLFLAGRGWTPTHNSELAASVGLEMLAADGEIGSEVFCGGRVEKQARKVFHAAAEMVRKEKRTFDFLGVEIWGPRRNPDAITLIDKNAKFEPLIGKPDDGDNPHCYICDEYHEHQTDEQFDTMKSGMGARMQGLILIITTAGGSIGGPCHSYEDNAKKVLQGVISDADHQFIAIWEADAEDDWKSDEALIKANPNLNVSVFLSKLKKDRADAINRNKSATFKAKHLNLWVGAEDAYFSIEHWLSARTHADGLVTLKELEGRRCWLGLDLAQKTDFCALAIWSPRPGGGFDIWTRFWLPEVTVESTAEGHNYRRWAYEGDFPAPEEGAPPDFDNCPAITLTDGAMVDFDHVEQDVWDIWKSVDAVDLAFDPAHAAGLIPRLMKRGVTCIEFPNTAKNMSDPMMLLDGYIRDGLIRHSGNPVMDWMISNTVRRKSKRLDLDYPDRSMPDNKIDGVVAALMAGGRQVYAEEAPDDFILRVR